MAAETRPIALLLEDEALIALDVAATLEELGFEVVSHNSCATALRWLIGHHNLAIAVIDVQLLDGDCDEVAKLILKRGVPHIIHSGVATAVAPFDQGVWLAKPCSSAQLTAAVHSAVGAAEGRAETGVRPAQHQDDPAA